MKKSIAPSILVGLFSLFLALPGISRGEDTKKILNIGTTAGDFATLAKEGLAPELAKKGYEIKVTEFTDYMTPNFALAEGRIDANIFQHKPYLEQFTKEKGVKLTAVAQVPTAPLGLYPGRLKSLNQIKTGSRVAVPNDPTNLSRALTILADLGWIELSPKADPLLISERDIIKNPKNLKINLLEAAQLPRALEDVDFAVINGNYAANAGISLSSALTQEKSDLYVNWVVTTEKNAKAKFAQEIEQALNSEAFQKYAKTKFKGYKFPSAWTK